MIKDPQSPFSHKANGLDFVIAKDSKALGGENAVWLGGMLWCEWEALFFVALGCKDYPPYSDEQDFTIWKESARKTFQQSIPEYFLLSRVWDYYGKSWYLPEEIAQLRVECVAAQNKINGNAHAQKALNQFLYACDKALEKGFGLEISGP